MFCPNCGSKMADGALFCGNCGNKLAAPEMPVQETPAPVYEAPVQEPVYEAPVQQPVYEAPVQQPVYEAPVQQPVYQQPVYQPPVTPAPVKQKKKKGLGWLWAILIILVVGAVAVLALDYFDIIPVPNFLGGDQYVFAKEVVTYNADEEETSYTSVELNKNGFPETITIEEEGNNRTIEIKYGKNNVIKSATTTWENGNEHYEEFDKHGNVIYAEDGSTEYEYEYKYDKKGNILEEISYIDGEESYTTVYEYDKEGNVTYYEYNDADDEDWSYARIYEYKYDKKGNIIKEVCVDADTDEELYTETSKYDSKGNLVSSEYDDQNTVTFYEYEYNKKGKITYIGAYDEDDNEVYACEYKYDKNGNQTAVYVYYDGELDHFTEYSWFSSAKKLTDAQFNVLGYLDILSMK